MTFESNEPNLTKPSQLASNKNPPMLYTNSKVIGEKPRKTRVRNSAINLTTAKCKIIQPKPISHQSITDFWNPLVPATHSKSVAQFPFQHVYQYQQQFARNKARVADLLVPQLQYAANSPTPLCDVMPDTSVEGKMQQDIAQSLYKISTASKTVESQGLKVSSKLRSDLRRFMASKRISKGPSVDVSVTKSDASKEKTNAVPDSSIRYQNLEALNPRASYKICRPPNVISQPVCHGGTAKLMPHREMSLGRHLKYNGIPISPEMILSKDAHSAFIKSKNIHCKVIQRKNVHTANSGDPLAYCSALLEDSMNLTNPQKNMRLKVGNKSATTENHCSDHNDQNIQMGYLPKSILEILEKTSQKKVSTLRLQLAHWKERGHLGTQYSFTFSSFIVSHDPL